VLVTRVGLTPLSPIARSQQLSAAVAFRRSVKYTSTTCPSWLIALYKYAHLPVSLQYVSSTLHFPLPAA
jgi:hypothetical protein